MHVCPTGASYVDENGMALIDKEKCIGCKYCMMACPYGVRSWNSSEGKVEKCTLCGQLTAAGKQPACVAACCADARFYGNLDDATSTGAIRLAEVDDAAKCNGCGRCEFKCPSNSYLSCSGSKRRFPFAAARAVIALAVAVIVVLGGALRLGAGVPCAIDPALSIADELDAARSSHGGHACGSCAGCETLKNVGGKRDGVQVDSRHIVLLGALGSAAVFGFPVLCLICPVGLAFAFLIGLASMFQFNEPSWALLVAPAVLVLEIVFLRKWCTKFCPISALVSLISAGNKAFKPQVDQSKCLRGQGIDCHACVEACPEQLDPHTEMIPECSKCDACVTTCPTHSISIKALSLK